MTESTIATADHVREQLDLFETDEDAIRRVLAVALERGADFADLYFQHRSGRSIGLEDGLVSRASSSVDRGVGVRVVVGDQTGYAYSERLELEPMLAAARTAATIAAGGKAVAPQALQHRAIPQLYPLTRQIASVTVDETLPLVRHVEQLVRACDPTVEKVSVSWGDSDDRVLLASSDGDLFGDRRPMTRLTVAVTCLKDGERQFNSGSLAGRRGLEWYTEARLTEFAKDLVARTLILFEARRPPAGELPVVLAAGASGILLHEAVGHGMEADFNRKGMSIYAGQIGETVAPDQVTIVDSALHPGERGALGVDDEGQATERTVLVENGVMRSYLHDRISAKHYGVEPTGSGRRESFRHVPMPRMRCTYMENGPHTREEIIASIDRGVICENFLNGQVQIGAGDFTFFVKNGWLVEGGKITAPIKDVNIIGNGPEAIRRISMVAGDMKLDTGGWTCGKEGQSVPVSQGMPTVLVSSLTVGGSNAQ
ncbi:TldD/PmbA family protein [Engelhardtia mirabilis]|uniref:Protease TldD n=1 Tax=Engelhardtia mirabilis TaxID=2528011 RepID=A0A518BG22_9BACT|nr:protease TldD [Planctomycetes bacterium Pla133]QDV00253.1 protease TldD [Planctomycetes bacterium Pla86]